MNDVAYHIKPDGTKAVCHAKKKTCRYAAVTAQSTPEGKAEQAELEAFIKESEVNYVQRIATTKLHPPLSEDVSLPGSAFSFQEDYYFQPGDTLSTEVDYVDMREVLANFHGVSAEDIPHHYFQHAVDEGWNKQENFIVERGWGYYSEIETYVAASPELVQKVNDYYVNMEDADDAAGVLQYCRDKGFSTAGKTPVEALKAQLKTENGGKSHRYVDRANTVDVAYVKLDRIKIAAQRHYESIEARDLKPVNRQHKEIAGVVYYRNNEYILVDGYHRTKFLNQSARHKNGRYFVLSHDNFWDE